MKSRRELHERVGYWGLFASVAFGMTLEAVLAFKVGGVVDAGMETRRLLLRLAHAHGGFLSLANLVFAVSMNEGNDERFRRASMLLFVGSVLVPLGFLLGGLFLHGNDPGAGIVFAPIGGVALLAAFFLRARDAGR